MEVIARQNGVEHDAGDGGNGQRGQGNGGTTHMEGESVRKAQTTHQNDRGDDQIPRIGEVHLVLHHVPHADGGDHTVEDEADAADDSRGDGVDEGGELGAEGQHHRVDGGQPDHTRIVDPGEHQHAGVLTVSGVGGATEEARQRGGNAVADQRPVKARVLDEVLTHGGGDGGHIANVLHHGGDGDGGHHQDGGDVKLGDAAAEVGDEGLEAHPAGSGHAGKIHLSGNQGHNVGTHHAQQNGDNLDHTLAPDVGHDDDGHGHQSQPPAGGGVGHGGGGQVQADQDNDGTSDHRGQVVHDPVHAHGLDDQGQHHVQQAGHHNAAAGILELFRGLHSSVDTGVHLRHGLEPAQEGKGGTQEGRDLHPGAHMEKQRAEAGEK